jgi:hypothetical protein
MRKDTIRIECEQRQECRNIIDTVDKKFRPCDGFKQMSWIRGLCRERGRWLLKTGSRDLPREKLN